MSLTRCFQLAVLLATCSFISAPGFAIEPYPFKYEPREFPAVEWLRLDFEGPLPTGSRLGENALIEDGTGTNNSKALVNSEPGTIGSFPIQEFDVGISRFDLTLDYSGEGYAYFVARLNAYNRQREIIRRVDIGSAWGSNGRMRTWETRVVNLEFEDIYAVELELEQLDIEYPNIRRQQTNPTRIVRIDNVVLRRHEARVIYGERARKELTEALYKEDVEVSNLGDIFIADGEERQSFFDLSIFPENKRFVRSHWQERTHIGSTYKVSHGKIPTFLLGVIAKQATLELAAVQQGMSLVEMYEFFLDDVADHGFNTVWVDFTTDLVKFDELASQREISIILRDPGWSGLESWVANPGGPMPEQFKQAATKNFAIYSKLKALIGYQMNRPLSRNYQPMLAQARTFLASLNPKIQLVTEESDLYSAERIEKPYPHIGIARRDNRHYVGWPNHRPSLMYDPNYWTNVLIPSVGGSWHRRIHSAFVKNYMPSIAIIQSGREYGKKAISMNPDYVVPETAGWTFDEETRRFSGWNRYRYPQSLLTAMVYKAIESGASGVMIEEWGPATIPHDITGPQILEGSQYPNGFYQPDLLRRADMSESEGWHELGELGRNLQRFRHMMAESTPHGNNTASVSNGNIKVATLTGRDQPFKLIFVTNTQVGDYEESELKISPEDGTLEGFEPSNFITFNMVIDKDFGLISFADGQRLEPISTDIKTKSSTYEVTLGPGEGRLYFKGKPAVYQNFIKRYKIPELRSATTAQTEGR